MTDIHIDTLAPVADSLTMKRQSRSSATGWPIHFGTTATDEPVHWVGVSAVYHYGVGSNPTESTDHRIMAWAMLRMDFDGIAVFKRGELARLCAQVDRKTGELRPLGADALNRAIGRLVGKGYLHHESWSRAIFVPLFVAQNGQGRTAKRQPVPRKPGFNGKQAPEFGRAVEG